MSIHPKDVFDAIKAFLADLWEKNITAAPAVQTEQTWVGQAAGDVEVAGAAIISGLADQAVNDVLGLAPGGSSLDSFADSLIDAVIVGLTARKSAVA
jgi:hypothetical protein